MSTPPGAERPGERGLVRLDLARNRADLLVRAAIGPQDLVEAKFLPDRLEADFDGSSSDPGGGVTLVRFGGRRLVLVHQADAGRPGGTVAVVDTDSGEVFLPPSFGGLFPERNASGAEPPPDIRPRAARGVRKTP